MSTIPITRATFETGISTYTKRRIIAMEHELTMELNLLDDIKIGIQIGDCKFARKTVEAFNGPKGSRDHMIGWLWYFFDPNNAATRVRVRITGTRYHNTLREYIEAEGWQRIAPHIGSNIGVFNAYIAIYESGYQVFSETATRAGGGITVIEFIPI